MSWDKPSMVNETDMMADDKSMDTDKKIQDEWVDVNHKLDSGNDDSLTMEKHSSSKTSSDLPEGWAELTDESSGRKYYYHESDNVTTWERPVIVSTSFEKQKSRSLQSNVKSSTTRQRPAHAIASFGFGGRLCVMKSQVVESLSFFAGLERNNSKAVTTIRKGLVEIHRLSSYMSNQNLCRSGRKSAGGNDVSGPLNSLNSSKVLSYLASKSGEVFHLHCNSIR